MTTKTLAIGSLILAAFLACQAVLLKDYISKDTREPAWDQAVHMEIALDYRQAIREGRWGDIFNLPPKPGMPPFPPLYHLALTLAYDWSPSNPAGAALWLNFFYLVALCLSLFGIAWEYGLEYRAWVPAVAFACTPAVQALCRTQLVDLAVAAWVAAAYWAYIRSERFARWPGDDACSILRPLP